MTKPPTPPRRLTLISDRDLMSMKFPDPELALAPWLHVRDYAVVYGLTGFRTTWASLGIAAAIATGTTFLGWTAPRPRTVVYFDGSNQARFINARLKTVFRSCSAEAHQDPLASLPPPRRVVRDAIVLDASKNLSIVLSDAQGRRIPSLAVPAGQRLVEDLTEGADVLILDNFGRLCPTAAWEGVRYWLSSLRRRGLTTVLDLNAREGDEPCWGVLNAIIALKRPRCGLGFTIQHERIRNAPVSGVPDIEAQLISVGRGAYAWQVRPAEIAPKVSTSARARRSVGSST